MRGTRFFHDNILNKMGWRWVRGSPGNGNCGSFTHRSLKRNIGFRKYRRHYTTKNGYGGGLLSICYSQLLKYGANFSQKCTECDDTKKNEWIIAAPFCTIRYINCFQYLPGETLRKTTDLIMQERQLALLSNTKRWQNLRLRLLSTILTFKLYDLL